MDVRYGKLMQALEDSSDQSSTEQDEGKKKSIEKSNLEKFRLRAIGLDPEKKKKPAKSDRSSLSQSTEYESTQSRSDPLAVRSTSYQNLVSSDSSDNFKFSSEVTSEKSSYHSCSSSSALLSDLDSISVAGLKGKQFSAKFKATAKGNRMRPGEAISEGEVEFGSYYEDYSKTKYARQKALSKSQSKTLLSSKHQQPTCADKSGMEDYLSYSYRPLRNIDDRGEEEGYGTFPSSGSQRMNYTGSGSRSRPTSTPQYDDSEQDSLGNSCLPCCSGLGSVLCKSRRSK